MTSGSRPERRAAGTAIALALLASCATSGAPPGATTPSPEPTPPPEVEAEPAPAPTPAPAPSPRLRLGLRPREGVLELVDLEGRLCFPAGEGAPRCEMLDGPRAIPFELAGPVARGATLPAPTLDGAPLSRALPVELTLADGVESSTLPAAPSWGEVRRALFVLGGARRVLDAGPSRIALVAGREEDLDALAEGLEHAQVAAFARLGEAAAGPLWVAFSRGAPASEGGPGWHWWRAPAGPAPHAAASLLEAVAGSVVAGPAWLRRGFGRYAGWHLRQELEDLPPRALLQIVADAWEAHRRAPGTRPIASGEDTDGAALALFCAELELRAAGRRLFEVLPEGPLDAAGLREALAAVDPALAARHDARLAYRGVLDLDACLGRAGLRVVAVRVPRLGEDALRSLFGGATLEGEPPTVVRSPGPLRPGDVLTHLRGRPVRRMADVALHLAGLDGGRRVPAVFQRGERTRRQWLTLPRGLDEAGAVRFVLDPEEAARHPAFPFTRRPPESPD
ncbi:MAG TPA: hypothetical protein RMH85_01375 [Polyangiaceae bacterium LLY-WYZ-15_(1-7)]|nr:hypothetical protein [Myxococcales bacterium]MAT27899.1 hypothetical protein [Sandaracinus sp.]HJL02640.1 hypothetical protein [Polyangiaceae bacterium LLY-WYZ-15_(1-7)]MBJ74150.1 hypothetical protein [Sandaracinus sp.]HJL07113.1 hypothetical protein [Polyangiaceae bacterium LLY-WYZ-15_(1-7)]